MAGFAVILGPTFPVTPTYANTAARHKSEVFLDKLHNRSSPQVRAAAELPC